MATALSAGPLAALDDPFGPARLAPTDFTSFTSWDPGLPRDGRPIMPVGNFDFGSFARDCRGTPGETPIALNIRTPGAGCPPHVEGLVLAHATGPGRLGRIWLTVLDLTSIQPWGSEQLRVYVDGQTAPVVRATYSQLFHGEGPLGPPHAGMRSASFVSYWPIAWQEEIWVTLARPRAKVYYYQVDVVRGGEAVETAGDGDGSRAEFRTSTAANLVYDAGAGAFVHAAEGPGAWLELRFSANEAAAERLRTARLAFAFDGVTSAARVGDLCAAGHRWAEWETERVAMARDGDGAVRCTLRWGWPFAEAGRVALAVSDPAGISAAVVPTADPPAPVPAGRFYVQAASHTTAAAADRLRWADVAGRGRLVGLHLAAAAAPDADLTVVTDRFGFLEGDETVWADGVLRTRGTGTEDLFNGGFYFRDGPYAWTYGGLASKTERANGWGEVQMARYFLGADRRDFRRSFRGDLEIGADHPELDHDYRSLAVFYLAP